MYFMFNGYAGGSRNSETVGPLLPPVEFERVQIVEGIGVVYVDVTLAGANDGAMLIMHLLSLSNVLVAFENIVTRFMPVYSRGQL
jgi:hypothetical protein